MNFSDLVNQAITAGFGEEQILEFLGNKIPGLKEGIRGAQKSGFLPSKILRFLSNSLPSKNRPEVEKQKNINDQYLSSIGLKTRQEREASRNKALKGALGVGAGILGGMAAARAIPAIAGSKVGKSILSGIGLSPKTSPSSQDESSTAQTSQLPVQSAQFPQQREAQQSTGQLPVESQMQTQASSQSPLQQNLSQAQSPSGASPKERANAIISKLGIEENINKANKRGKKFENIVTEVISSLNPKQKQEYQNLSRSAQIPPMAQLVKDYLSSDVMHQSITESQLNSDQNNLGNQPKIAENMQIKPKIAENMQIQENISPETEKSTSEPPQKGSIASTPDGKIGEIKSIRNGQALIESDGKLHKVKESDLQGPPIPEKDLGDLWEDVLRGIEKETGEEVSRNVEWAGYDPEANELFYKPHLGPGYTYKNIPEEDVKLLTSILTTRKTTGENFIGAWKTGSKSPIGAAMAALIKKLQEDRGGKGKEYSRKYQTIYAAHEPAQQALKNKKKKKK